MGRKGLLLVTLFVFACGPDGDGKGVESFNEDGSPHQRFVAGSNGTDFAISTVGGVTTFDIPSASAGNRGLLMPADYSDFAGKLSSINGDKSLDHVFAVDTGGSDFQIVTSAGTTTFQIPSASTTNRGLLTSADWSSFAAKVGSINGDTAVNHVIAAGSGGNDFNIATAAGTTTLNLPSASAASRGLVTAADWTVFDAKLDQLLDDPAPTLGGDLQVNGFQITSALDTNVTVSPAGTGVMLVNKAVVRQGFFQAYAAFAQPLPDTAGSTLTIELTQQTRLDADYYAHDAAGTPTDVTILSSGDYKISYTVTAERNNGRHAFRAWLEANDTELIASKSYCIVRNDDEASTCSVSGTTIADLQAGDVLTLLLQGRRQTETWGLDNEADTVPNEVWITIEKI